MTPIYAGQFLSLRSFAHARRRGVPVPTPDHGGRLAPVNPVVRESLVFRAPSWGQSAHEEADMSKRGRKRRARAKSAANHGKRPNA